MPEQQRAKKFIRQPERFANRQVTDRSIDIIEYLVRYRFLSRSLIIRLVTGDSRTTDDHLQWMWHKGLLQRFAFVLFGKPGEFNYYLDNNDALRLLKEHRPQFRLGNEHWEDVRNNRMRDYVGAVGRSEHGRMLFLQHELMISRFHALLELACRKSSGQVQLANFIQGAALNSYVEVPELTFQPGQRPGSGEWVDGAGTERLPHRPDAFASLRFLDRPADKQLAHFFYEADRKTMKSTDMKMKLRAHFHFCVRRQRDYLQKIYGIDHIRAVLVETLDEKRLDELRSNSRTRLVSGRPSPLFWFTATEFLEGDDGAASEPLYLTRPEIILKPIWLTPVDDALHSLTDV
jgi:hypothetical protein